MAIKYLNKPIFLAAVICVIFFYSNKDFILKKENITSIIKTDEISSVQGIISSSPVKTSDGRYYSSFFQLKNVASNNGVLSSAKGRIKIFIPSALVESLYPGKLYSLAKDSFLFETGGFYSFSGINLKQGFFINSCEDYLWQDSLSGKIAHFRALCRLHFKRLMYGWKEGGGLLLALISGSKEYTAPKLSEAFRKAGLSHILALSGMHLAIFSAIALFIGKRIKRKRFIFFIRIISLFIFIWFAGFSPSLSRAFICTSITLIADITGFKKTDNLLILCSSFLLQSIIQPMDIYNISFILSYGALAGIFMTNKFFYMLLIKIIPSFLASPLSSSLSAQFFTAPITLKLFNTFCPIGIIATIIISPLITIFIYSGLFLLFITMLFPILQNASGIFINFQYNVIKNLVIFFSQAPIWSLNEPSRL